MQEKLKRIALDQANAAQKNRTIVVSGGTDTYNKLVGGGISRTKNKVNLSLVESRPITAKNKTKEELDVESLEKELKRADERMVELQADPTKNEDIIRILKEKMEDPRIRRKKEKKELGFETIVPLDVEISKGKRRKNALKRGDPELFVRIFESGDRKKIGMLTDLLTIKNRMRADDFDDVVFGIMYHSPFDIDDYNVPDMYKHWFR